MRRWLCRLVGHRWELQRVEWFESDPPGNPGYLAYAIEHERCRRCGGERQVRGRVFYGNT